MKRNSHLPLAFLALAGTTLAVTACNPSGAGAAAKAGASAAGNPSTAKPSFSHAARPSSSPSLPAASRPATSAPPVSSPPSSDSAPKAPGSSASLALTRVSADCGPLSARPSSIRITCGDGGLGVEKLAWSNWGHHTASGQGTLYENQCQPNCAEGKFAYYPVAVTLSGVKNSPGGSYFSELSVTWEAGRPANATPNSFTLEGPAS